MKRNTRTLALPSDPAMQAAVQVGYFLLLVFGGILLSLNQGQLLLSRLSPWPRSPAVNTSSADPVWELMVSSFLALTAWGLMVVGGQLNRLWRAREE